MSQKMRCLKASCLSLILLSAPTFVRAQSAGNLFTDGNKTSESETRSDVQVLAQKSRSELKGSWFQRWLQGSYEITVLEIAKLVSESEMQVVTAEMATVDSQNHSLDGARSSGQLVKLWGDLEFDLNLERAVTVDTTARKNSLPKFKLVSVQVNPSPSQDDDFRAKALQRLEKDSEALKAFFNGQSPKVDLKVTAEKADWIIDQPKPADEEGLTRLLRKVLGEAAESKVEDRSTAWWEAMSVTFQNPQSPSTDPVVPAPDASPSNLPLETPLPMVSGTCNCKAATQVRSGCLAKVSKLFGNLLIKPKCIRR